MTAFRDMRFMSLLVLTVAANMGAGIIAPILPIYFKQYGIGTVALSAPFATLVAGRLISRTVTPSLIARYGHRHIVAACFLLYGTVFVLYLGSTSIYHFAALRFLEGIVEGILAVALNDLAIAYTKGAAPAERVRSMGNFGAAFGLGFLLGPLVGSAASYLFGLQAIFIAGAAIGYAAVAMTAWQIENAPAGANRNIPQFSGLGDTGLLIGLYSPQCLRRVVFFSLLILLPLQVNEHLHLAPEAVGLFFAASAVITTTIMPVSSAVAKRLGIDGIVLGGLVTMGVTLLALGTLRTVVPFTVVFLLETTAFALMLPSAMTVFGEAIDNQARRTGLVATMSFVTEILSLPLAVILPAFYAIGPIFAWSVVALLSFAALAAFQFSRQTLARRAVQ